MKKYEVIISSAKDVKLLNDKITTDSLFTVGETITNNPLHVGINVVTDERIIDSMKELAHKRGYCTNKDWMTFYDCDLFFHKYAVCSKHVKNNSWQYIVDSCEHLNVPCFKFPHVSPCYMDLHAEYTSESIWGLGTFEYFYLTKSNLDVLLDFIRIITSK